MKEGAYVTEKAQKKNKMTGRNKVITGQDKRGSGKKRQGGKDRR